jgi:ABC-type Zn uptake system ZnuABC Zn-binding protein ZnuA
VEGPDVWLDPALSPLNSRRVFLTNVLLCSPLGAGCRRPRQNIERPPAPRHVTVAATLGVIAELVGRIGGDNMSVVALPAPGQRLGQLVRSGPNEAKLLSCDLIVSLGLGAESSLAVSFERARKAGTRVCELAGAIDQALLFPGADGNGIDPHIWMDPGLWGETIDPLVAALKSVQPSDVADIETLGHTARFELKKLAEDLRSRADVIAPERRRLRTTNSGLRYLARATGIEVELAPPKNESLEIRRLEALQLDTLMAPGGEKVVARSEAHDLSLHSGLVRYAADLIVEILR